MTDKPLGGKVALVTGAGRGIGREIALRLARDGASIVVHYSGSKVGADQTVAEIEGLGGAAVAYQADIAKRQDVAALFQSIDRDPGRLDIVVNNSGVSGSGGLADLNDADVEAIFGINVFGPLYIASEAAKRLREARGSSTSAPASPNIHSLGPGFIRRVNLPSKASPKAGLANWARAILPSIRSSLVPRVPA